MTTQSIPIRIFDTTLRDGEQSPGASMNPTENPVALAGIFLLAVLMVSNLKFASFKEFDLRKRKPFPVLLGIIVLLILIVNEPQIVLFTIGVIYVLHGPVWSFFLWKKRRAETLKEGETSQ